MGFNDAIKEANRFLGDKEEINEAKKQDTKSLAKELKQEIDKGTYWEDAYGKMEKKFGIKFDSVTEAKINREFKKITGKTPDSYQEE